MAVKSNSDIANKEILLQLDNFPKAAQFINAVLSQKYRVICFGGAIRSGKTFNAIGSLVLLHKAFPGSRSIIVRENLDILRKNTLPSCEKAVPSNFVRQFKGDPQFEWTFTNSSRMFFFAEGYEKDKNYDRWNGLEVNFILLEQVEELQKMSLEKALERIGSYVIPNGEQPQPLVIMTVNPTRTWAKELIYDRYIDGTLPDKWLYIPALLTDNPFIPDNFKEGLQELKRVNPVRYQRYVEGDWEVQDVIEGAFWKSFSYELHVKSLDIDLNLPLHISFDENVNPYPALSIWQVEDKNARQLHEICLRHPENKLIKVAKEFVKWARAQNWNNLVYIYGDATSQKEDAKLQAGYNYFTMLKNEIEPHFRCQIRKPSKNPPVALSADFINSIFELNYDDISIKINEDCHESIKDYTTVQEAPDGTMIKKKTGGVELTGHYSDNLRYFLTEIFKDSFRKYQRGTSVLDYTLAPAKEQSY